MLPSRECGCPHFGSLRFFSAARACAARATRRFARFFSIVFARASASFLVLSRRRAKCSASAASIFWIRASILALKAIAGARPSASLPSERRLPSAWSHVVTRLRALWRHGPTSGAVASPAGPRRTSLARWISSPMRARMDRSWSRSNKRASPSWLRWRFSARSPSIRLLS